MVSILNPQYFKDKTDGYTIFFSSDYNRFKYSLCLYLQLFPLRWHNKNV